MLPKAGGYGRCLGSSYITGLARVGSSDVVIESEDEDGVVITDVAAVAGKTPADRYQLLLEPRSHKLREQPRRQVA